MEKLSDKSLPDSVSQVHVVTLAVYLLGGESQIIDTEDVAIKAAELAPGRFVWKKYPDQINLELVRVYLSVAKKEAKGHLIDGTGKMGWSLTAAGLEWINKEGRKLFGKHFPWQRTESVAGGIDEVRWRRERERIISTLAWEKWNTGKCDDILLEEAQEVFRIDSYATSRLFNLKLNRAMSLFEKDDDVKAFIERIRGILLTREKSRG